MRHRPRVLGRGAALAGAVLLAGAADTGAQEGSARTAWGDPDLQGVYTFATITPLQRPDDVEGRERLSAEEAASFEERTARERVDRPPRPGDTGTYNRFWVDYGTRVVGTRRTSLIVDPPDGRLPPPAPEAQARTDARRAAGPQPPAGHEDLSITDRCIMGFNAGPPFVPSAYNNTVQLFQTPDHVVILNEMIHDARIVPLDGRPHLGAGVRQWMGDSRGRWEGDTLVVETANFASGRDMTRGVNIWRYVDPRGPVGTARLVERFTRLDGGTLDYAFTIDDPGTWTRPWSATFPLVGIEGELFEYACHEGNYSAANILAGARAEERQAPAERPAEPAASGAEPAAPANAASGEIATTQIAVGDLTFDVRVAGPEDGEVVLLLHGFPQTSWEWRHQLRALGEAGFRAVAPDQRGYSPGARPPDVADYALPLLVGDALGIADAIGAERFHVAGHDWGAVVAWALAVVAPQRVITANPVSVPHPDAFARVLRDPASCQVAASAYFDVFVQPNSEDGFLANDHALLRALFLELEASATEEYLRVLGTKEALGAALNWYRANIANRQIEQPPIGPVEVPTMFTWSDGDQALCIDGAELSAEYAAGPYRFEVLEGVSHWVPELAAEALSALLVEHVTEYSER